MTHLLVLPSPFLGSDVYSPLPPALVGTGHSASVAPTVDPPEPNGVIEAWTQEAARTHDVVLLPHSNAGLLAPAVAALVGAPIVFMDAALPLAEGSTPMAPPNLLTVLEGLAGPDGRLPRWTRWWARDELAEVLPDPWFERLDALVPEVPLSYVHGEAPVPAAWERESRAYLAFGSTYADEVATATRLGWPVHTVTGAHHLHCVVEPDDTAAAVTGLLTDLGVA